MTKEKILRRKDCVAGIQKLDDEIIRISSMCQSLRRKISDLAIEQDNLANDYSARILSNTQIASLIEEYSEIVRRHNVACKEFSRLDPGLEKIMGTEDDAQELISSVKKAVDEAASNFDFKTSFEESQAYIFEVLTPTINRIIEVEQMTHLKTQDALASFASRTNKANVLKTAFWLLSGTIVTFLAYGFFTVIKAHWR